MTNANTLIAEINQGKGTIGMLAKDPQFQAKFRDTVDKLDGIVDKINSGQGSIGQLVVNPSLYNNADAMLTREPQPGDADPREPEEVPDLPRQGLLRAARLWWRSRVT